jgi:ectoine hydroxylase-related dioxygenase (phytanoyl-CoA dioxygenase family)
LSASDRTAGSERPVGDDLACAFREHRHVVVRSLLAPGMVAAVQSELDRQMQSTSASSRCGIWRSKDGVVVVANQLEKASDLLFDLQRAVPLIAVAEALLGRAVVPLQVEYFHNPPRSPHCAPPHQDHAFYTHFPDELAISLWTTLDELDKDSGGLEFVVQQPAALLPHDRSLSYGFDLELSPSVRQLVYRPPLALGAGDSVAFDSLAVHRSTPNRSGRPRRAIVFNYRGSPYREATRSSRP